MARQTKNRDGDSLQELVTDDRLFCVRLVSSVLTVYNEVFLRRPYDSLGTPQWKAEAEVAGRALDWVRQVNRMKVRAGGFREDAQTIWEAKGHPGNNVIDAVAHVGAFFITPDPDPARPIITAIDHVSPRKGWAGFWHRSDVKASFARWIDDQLSHFNEWTKLRLEGTAIVRTTLVQLNTVERCVAYSLALMIGNSYGLRSALRICPFTGRDFAKPHYFLDFRFEAENKNKRARGEQQLYCTRRHAGAARQRRKRS